MRNKRLGYRSELYQNQDLYEEIYEEFGGKLEVKLPIFKNKKQKKIKRSKNPNIKEEPNDF